MAARFSSGSERTHAAVSAATIRCSPSQLRSLRERERWRGEDREQERARGGEISQGHALTYALRDTCIERYTDACMDPSTD
jgi:hypothetical protein